MEAARPLSSYPLVRTDNAEEFRASFERIYGTPVLEFVGRNRTLSTVVNHCSLTHIEINYASYGGDLRLRFPESGFVTQIFPIGGKGQAEVDGNLVPADFMHSLLVPSNAPAIIRTNAEYERLALCVNSSQLTKLLASLTGSPVRVPLRMDPVQEFATQSAQRLHSQFMFFVRELNLATGLPRLLLAEFEQALMVTFLHANRHNYSHLLEEDPADAAPREVRRAEEYIAANWHEPLSLETLAAEAGVSVRSLAGKFRQWRGYSPSEFLQQVRLRHARRALQNAGSPATVADVALACGFASIARFNKNYIELFGEHPSVTLAHSR